MKLTQILFFILFLSMSVSEQAEEMKNPGIEQEIRKLDLLEAEAMQQKDIRTLDGILADNFLVNSPRNQIVKGKNAVKELVRNGIINYESFKREIESIMIEDNVA